MNVTDIAVATMTKVHDAGQEQTAMNNLCRVVLGLEADFYYGPFLFRADLGTDVACVPPTVGWGWPFLFHAAIRRGCGSAPSPAITSAGE